MVQCKDQWDEKDEQKIQECEEESLFKRHERREKEELDTKQIM